ncbi:M48 family metallopeptidase [Pseudogemmobacter faecipullorum]|nr:M48 family metallopeptidase [Pseudogemmobacter faecipullorum]
MFVDSLARKNFSSGRLFLLLAAGLLSGCVGLPLPGGMSGGADGPGPGRSDQIITASGRPLPANAPLSLVVARVEPVMEQICRERVKNRDCNFVIAVDDEPGQAANAFQTLDPSGRPVVVFTSALLNMAQNLDELAFVLGHEAAHHIEGHIPRRQDQAATGAILVGILGQSAGLSGAELARVQEIGAGLAAQQYSKAFELEADGLGAEIALYAGFDPQRGAAFFARLPDPGDKLLGSHPANAERQAVVAARVRRLTGS